MKMAGSQPDSLNVFDSMDFCTAYEDKEEGEQMKEVPLHELSSAQLSCLDPFRWMFRLFLVIIYF